MNNFQDPRQRCASGGYSLDKQQPTMKTPTKEQILEAAKTSPEAKDALKKLFPEVFEEDKYFNLSDFKDYRSGCAAIYARTCGNLARKSLYLSNEVNWEIKEDSQGSLCLIPTKKD